MSVTAPIIRPQLWKYCGIPCLCLEFLMLFHFSFHALRVCGKTHSTRQETTQKQLSPHAPLVFDLNTLKKDTNKIVCCSCIHNYTSSLHLFGNSPAMFINPIMPLMPESYFATLSGIVSKERCGDGCIIVYAYLLVSVLFRFPPSLPPPS